MLRLTGFWNLKQRTLSEAAQRCGTNMSIAYDKNSKLMAHFLGSKHAIEGDGGSARVGNATADKLANSMIREAIGRQNDVCAAATACNYSI
jgi:hypothetical protein